MQWHDNVVFIYGNMTHVQNILRPQYFLTVTLKFENFFLFSALQKSGRINEEEAENSHI